VQVFIFAFDLLYLNGEKLIKKPLLKRRELLKSHFHSVPGEFGFATDLVTDSMDQVQEFLEESIKGRCKLRPNQSQILKLMILFTLSPLTNYAFFSR